MTQTKYFQKLKHKDYVPFGVGEFKGVDITETIKPILEGIEKGIESFFANDFCPNCSNIMTYTSHFCKKCNQRVAVPLSFDMEIVLHIHWVSGIFHFCCDLFGQINSYPTHKSPEGLLLAFKPR